MGKDRIFQTWSTARWNRLRGAAWPLPAPHRRPERGRCLAPGAGTSGPWRIWRCRFRGFLWYLRCGWWLQCIAAQIGVFLPPPEGVREGRGCFVILHITRYQKYNTQKDRKNEEHVEMKGAGGGRPTGADKRRGFVGPFSVFDQVGRPICLL